MSWWVRAGTRPSSPVRGARREVSACAVCLLAFLLVGCAPGRSAYTPVAAGVDPYARLRERAEEYYQVGLAYERAADWRRTVQSYEQAILWDPDNRANVRAKLAHAREMVAALDPAVPIATPTFRPAGRAGATPVVQAGAIPTVVPTRTPTRAPSPTPTAPKAGYRAFRSEDLPYGIAYPIDWVARAGVAGQAEKRVDVFAGPLAGRMGASVLVTGVALSRAISAEQFYLQVVESLRTETGFRELAPRSVGGTVAYIVTYTTVEGGKSYATTHAVLLNGRMGWLITLLATPDTQANARAVFDTMLATFQSDGDIN